MVPLEAAVATGLWHVLCKILGRAGTIWPAQPHQLDIPSHSTMITIKYEFSDTSAK